MFFKFKDFLYRIPKNVFKKFRVFAFKLPTRLKIGIMMFCGSCVSYMLRSNFSIILLAMTKSSQSNFNWSNHEQNLLLSAYFWGYTLPNLIGGYLAEKYGGKIVIFLVFFLSSIITALSPMTASDNFWYLFMARLLLGFLGGFYFCTCHSLIALWSPPNEKGIFVSSLYGSSLGITITWPMMSFIIEKYSWQCAFYATAITSFITSIFWYTTVADSPAKHSKISKIERDYIEESLELIITSKQKFPPFKKMFQSAPFIALLWLHFSDVWGIYFILTSAPMFMNQVLKYDLKSVGIISCLPYVVRMLSAVFFGAIGDFLGSRKLLSATYIRKLFCIFSHIIPGIILFGFCFVEDDPQMCVILLIVSLGLNGASTMTSSQNAQDLAPNYAGSVFGIVNFFATMSGFLSPLVVSYFTREQSTIQEWRYIFVIDGLLYIITATFFTIFGSGNVQSWNKWEYKEIAKI